MKTGFLSNVRNFFTASTYANTGSLIPGKRDARYLSNYASPVQLTRIKQDIGTWREAIREAELAWLPHRVKMQQLFVDTILNEHVDSCWDKRKKLTTLKDFYICDPSGNENEKATALFKDKAWFTNLIGYILDRIGKSYRWKFS